MLKHKIDFGLLQAGSNNCGSSHCDREFAATL